MNFFQDLFAKLSNLLEYAKEHWFRILFIFLTFILFCVVFYFIPKTNIIENNALKEQNVLIFGITLENWFSYLSMIALIIAAVWAIYQFDKSNTLKQQERASEIAKSFSDKLTIKCSIICEVIKGSELYSLLELDSKRYDDFKIFNTNEIRNIYVDDNIIEKYKKKRKESNLDMIYYRLLESFISDTSFSVLMQENKQYSVEEARALFILDNSDLPFKFGMLVSNVLNELEYLCMGLSSQAAGSKYVYQSLHQVFLRTIRCLAVEIAMTNNKSYSDKYYTNIIHVYNEWTNLYILSLKKEDKLKNKVNKILDPKVKTV